MSPYARFLITSYFYNGYDITESVLNKLGLIFDEMQFSTIINGALLFLPENERKVFFSRGKSKKIEVSSDILKKINKQYGIKLTKKRGEQIIPNEVLRLIRNRELRIFLEILLLGRVPIETIYEALNTKFKINKEITEEDIKEYSFWMFDLRIMDDIDWQEYMAYLFNASASEEELIKIEYEDKLFALRNVPDHVILRAGIDIPLKFSKMLSVIANHVFESIQQDIEIGAPWRELDAKIKVFKTIGESYEKHNPDPPFRASDVFKDMELDLVDEDIDELPHFSEEKNEEKK